MTIREFMRGRWWLFPLLLAVVAFLGGSYHGRQRAMKSISVATDTVVRVVPVYKDFPQAKETAILGHLAVPTYKFLTDTVTTVESLVLHDTTVVYLPKEQRYYEEEDGRLRVWVSGYEPSLDRYELDQLEKVVTKTVTVKPSRWSVGIHAGYGAGVHDKGVVLTPYVGIGISYSVIQF